MGREAARGVAVVLAAAFVLTGLLGTSGIAEAGWNASADISPDVVYTDDRVKFTIEIENTDSRSMQVYDVDLFIDLGSGYEEFTVYNDEGTVGPGDSMTVVSEYVNIPPVEGHYSVKIEMEAKGGGDWLSSRDDYRTQIEVKEEIIDLDDPLSSDLNITLMDLLVIIGLVVAVIVCVMLVVRAVRRRSARKQPPEPPIHP